MARNSAVCHPSFRIYILLAAWATVSLACASLGAPAATPVPTLPAPLRWRHTITPGSSLLSPPALAGGLLVYLDQADNIVAADSATGTEKWHYRIGVPPSLYQPLPVTNGAVLAEEVYLDNSGQDRHRVLAVDLHTGQLLWQAPISPFTDTVFTFFPVAADGAVYYESETAPAPGQRWITAADAATGALRWQTPISGTAFDGNPAIAAGLVFVPVTHKPAPGSDRFTTDILALDMATGARRWLVETGSLAADVLAAGSGRVYATTQDGNCWAIDAATGKVAWKFPFPDTQPAPPVLAGDTLYFGDGQGRLYALDAATGVQRWMAQLGRNIRRRPAVGGGRVYVGSGDGNLNALDAATGSVLWKTENPMDAPFASNPFIPPMDTEPVVANGTLYYFNNVDMIALQVP